MNKAVVIIGSLVITLGFFGFFYYLLNLRSENLLLQQNTPQVERVLPPQTGVTAKMVENSQQEVKSFEILIRGTITAYNPNTQSLSLLMEDPAQLEADQLVEVNVNSITKFACWTSPVDPESDRVMDLRKAYFPIEEGSVLLLNNEQVIAQPSFTEYVNKFAFIKRNTTLPTTPIQAEQIAVLDC